MDPGGRISPFPFVDSVPYMPLGGKPTNTPRESTTAKDVAIKLTFIKRKTVEVAKHPKLAARVLRSKRKGYELLDSNPFEQPSRLPKIMCFGKKEANAEQDEGFRRNQDIEKTLREDKKRMAREIKILLLGKWVEGIVEELWWKVSLTVG